MTSNRVGARDLVSAGLMVATALASVAVIFRSLSWEVAVVAIVLIAGTTALLAIPVLRITRRDALARILRDRSLLEAIGSHARFAGESGNLPRVKDIDDPVSLGVHPAVPIPREQFERLVQQGLAPTANPPYVSRDASVALDAALTTSQFVLLVGDSTAGKSRTAFEAMRRLFSDRFLLIPAGPNSLHRLLEAGFSAHDVVLWLDDLEGYFGPGGLDLPVMSALLGKSSEVKVSVLGTMRTSAFAMYLDRTLESGHSDRTLDRDLLRVEREVLNRAVLINLPRRFSPAELARARNLAWDPRIAEALENANRFGVAEYLAAGPALVRRWRTGGDKESVGPAIVSATVDCRRAGVRSPVPEQWLRELFPIYLDRPAERVDIEAFSDGLQWATTPVFGSSSLLLRQGRAQYEVQDYLVDYMERSYDSTSIPKAIWTYLVDRVSASDAIWVGIEAYLAGRIEVAERAFRRVTENDLLKNDSKQGEVERGESSSVRTVEVSAAFSLGVLLRERGDLDEAERWWREAATSGDPAAAFSLGVLLRERGDLDEAERWWRRAKELRSVEA
jgi:tetratricopeptide (TPR) repeat protein